MERTSQVGVDFHESARVVKLVAVIGRREQCYHSFLMAELVAILHDLVRPADQVQVVSPEEVRRDLLAEHVAAAALGLGPPTSLNCGVSPEQVADEALLGHFGGSLDLPDLGWLQHRGRQATVHADDAVLDDSRDGQIGETGNERFPYFNVVSFLALVVETVDFGYALGLVVASQEINLIRVLDFQAKKQANGFDTVFSPVHVVAQKQVSRSWRRAPVREHPEQVIVLPVNIAANIDRRLQLQQHVLFQEDIPGSLGYAVKLILCQVSLLARLLIAELPQLGEYSVNVNGHAVQINWGSTLVGFVGFVVLLQIDGSGLGLA